MRDLAQSSTRDFMLFVTQSADHVTGLTGASLTITLSKNGAAFSSISPTVTERGSGWYSLALTSGNTDTLGDFALHVTAASADPTDVLAQVVSAAGSGDWTSGEKDQIRHRLGIDGTASAPAATPSLAASVQVDTVEADVAAVQADTNDIQTRLPAALDAGRMVATVGAYQSGQAPLQPTIAGRTLDVTAGGEAGLDLDNTVGTLSSAEIPNLDAAISTRAVAGDAMALTVSERAATADKLLGRSIIGGADGGRMVKDALKSLRNRTAISGGTLTVYEADDTTPAWTAAVTTAAGNPLTEIDPA